MVQYIQIIGSQTHQLKLQNRTAFRSLKIVYIEANSIDPDEMPHKAAFCLVLHCINQSMHLLATSIQRADVLMVIKI